MRRPVRYECSLGLCLVQEQIGNFTSRRDVDGDVITKCAGCAPRAAMGRPLAGMGLRDTLLGTVAAGALSLALAVARWRGRMPAWPRHHRDLQRRSIRRDRQRHRFYGPAGHHSQRQHLTPAITPAGVTGGINFASAGAITITSNTGAFGITTAGGFANGIYAVNPPHPRRDGDLDRQYRHNGRRGTGIVASSLARPSAAPVTVTSTGNIITTGTNANGIGAEASS